MLKDRLGGIELNCAGYVDTSVLLSAFRRFFQKKNAYINVKFDHNLLNLADQEVIYKDLRAKKAIFCEGAAVVKNNYFNWLPFGLVKGEIITLKMDLLPELIISKDIFLLPVKGAAKAGSTYDRNNIDANITGGARDYLVKKLKELLKNKFEVVGQQAGIRPGTKDRRPFMGLHPQTKLIGLFNGLGTKGVSLGPYCSDQFADFLVFNKEFDQEADLHRYS